MILNKENEQSIDIIELQREILIKLDNGFKFIQSEELGNHVHFQGSINRPVQRWFPYREGYSVELVDEFIKKLNINGLVFDPFSGSGTTLLAARLNNLPSKGMDVNPISVMVAEAENDQYNEDDKLSFDVYLNQLKLLRRDEEHYNTKFELADKAFNMEILQSILQIKLFIDNIENNKIYKLFYIAWISIIESVSNFKKEGNGIKYKNRKRTSSGYINIDKLVWEQSVFPYDKFNFVKDKIIDKLEIIKEDLNYNYGKCNYKPEIYKGSCVEFNQYFNEKIDFTFFSPPYCNCFDYFEIHKVELWLGEFVKSKDEMKSLRNTGFRSNTNALKNKDIVYRNEELERLIQLFDKDKLWSKRIPDVVRGYFDDMNTLLTRIYEQTSDGGYVGIVVGNSAYTGVIVPTDVLIARISEKIGFKTESIFITRHLTTSSQQKEKLSGLKDYLRESIVLLRKE